MTICKEQIVRSVDGRIHRSVICYEVGKNESLMNLCKQGKLSKRKCRKFKK